MRFGRCSLAQMGQCLRLLPRDRLAEGSGSMLLAVGDGRAFPGKLGYAKRKIARRGAGVYYGE